MYFWLLWNHFSESEVQALTQGGLSPLVMSHQQLCWTISQLVSFLHTLLLQLYPVMALRADCPRLGSPTLDCFSIQPTQCNDFNLNSQIDLYGYCLFFFLLVIMFIRNYLKHASLCTIGVKWLSLPSSLVQSLPYLIESLEVIIWTCQLFFYLLYVPKLHPQTSHKLTRIISSW